MRPYKLFIYCICIATFGLCSCEENSVPKPSAFLRLAYNTAEFKKISSPCPYSFEASKQATIGINEKCWINIHYPQLKASLTITYRPVENNLQELLQEAEKLTYNHAIKADGISNQPYVDRDKHKYGSLAEVSGNAASSIQFHVTDSVKHFLTGALYFEVKPNYDSILPAIKYLEKDVRHLMETLEWKE